MLGGYQFVLGQTYSLANGHGFSCFVQAQHIAGEGHVHESVVALVNGSRGTIESNGPTLLVKECSLADVALLSVERHDVARGGHPQGEVQRTGCLEISQAHDILMRNGISTSVTGIVHHERTLLHLLLDESGDIGIGIAR